MSTHSSLKEKKFKQLKRSRRQTHTGQEAASAKKAARMAKKRILQAVEAKKAGVMHYCQIAGQKLKDLFPVQIYSRTVQVSAR
jgi:hypothetical protein